MNTIDISGSAAELRQLIADNVRADYVYMYPPRQAYAPVDRDSLDTAVQKSLLRDAQANLYFHFPFCRQICAFCNLYAIADERDSVIDAYVDTLLLELRHYEPLLRSRRMDTLYLGGGTPSLFPAAAFDRLFNAIAASGLAEVADIPEVAIEAAPDTVTLAKFRDYRAIGINRVNIGIQAADDRELALIGRRHGASVAIQALDVLQQIGFSNICVDLIYGLEGQSDDTWRQSIRTVIERRPETICAYPLTLRPRTGFSARGYTAVDSRILYERYDFANETLQAAGYRQETHVRWILAERGGYRQKTNHWAGDDIVGIGAGARSYLQYVDYRNGYSIKTRRRALDEYVQRVRATGHGRCEGFLLDEDERRRRTAILGLGELDRTMFRQRHGVPAEDVFGDHIAAFEEIGALAVTPTGFAWTSLGQKYRDVLVQPLFSRRVMTAVSAFGYDE